MILRMMMVWLVAAALSLPVLAQEAVTLEAVLAGRIVPLTVKVKDLTPEWRIISSGKAGLPLGMPMHIAMELGVNPFEVGGDDLFTRGQTCTIGGVTFLVAYAIATSEEERMARMRMIAERYEGGYDGDDPFAMMTNPINGETTLTLSLLNLRNLGNMVNIRPFNLQEIEERAARMQVAIEEARARARRQQSLNNLRQIAIAIQMWAQDNTQDGIAMLPQMRTVEELRRSVGGYLGEADGLFENPITNEPYLINPNVSRRAMNDFDDVSSVIVAYESQPDEEGKRGVAFLDGHVELVNEERWEEIKGQLEPERP